jgi:hypothetical protein
MSFMLTTPTSFPVAQECLYFKSCLIKIIGARVQILTLSQKRLEIQALRYTSVRTRVPWYRTMVPKVHCVQIYNISNLKYVPYRYQMVWYTCTYWYGIPVVLVRTSGTLPGKCYRYVTTSYTYAMVLEYSSLASTGSPRATIGDTYTCMAHTTMLPWYASC